MADFQQQLLNRELRAVRQVRHPYILPYTGTAVFEFNKILIAPYMMNGNLLQYLERKTSLDRRPLLLQVATAVDFLHTEHRMIHGDLKCENVLVADDGRAQLADFGLSMIIDKTDASTRTATALRQQITIQFAAPELFLGETESQATEESGRPVRKTPQTDVYAFGMLVIQAFTGLPPWAGCKSAEILMKLHMRIAHPRPDNGAPPRGLCDAWWDACTACWTYEPSSRPTMRELMGKLDVSEPWVHETC
ncbi:kinase-like protein [Auricularia subglabra TFB-10046 SS5]|nr:kinase-like protein [Auricularia subglabra TFB-10046 SS5]